LNYLEIFGSPVSQGDQGLDPRWGGFSSALDARGFWSSLKDVAIFIDFSVSPRSIYRLWTLRNHTKVLVRVEPRSVNPGQFTMLVQNLFDICIDEESVATGTANFSWCAGFDFELEPETSSGRQYLLGALMGRKISFFGKSQYHMRTWILNSLTSSGVDVIFAGRGWQDGPASLLKTLVRAFIVNFIFRLPFLSLNKVLQSVNKPKVKFFGEVQRPKDFYGEVKVALVLENEEGALSEKLFDAISAGCSVVYMGRPFPKIPGVLQLKEGFTIMQIIEFLEGAESLTINQIREAQNVLRALIQDSQSSFDSLVDIILRKAGVRD
jgi:hypothetical protein